MQIKVYQNVTAYQAVRDMISAIDNSDLFVEYTIIVPDSFSLQCEKLLLELMPQKALFNVKVRTLTRFALELLQEMGIRANEVLSSGEVLLLTQKAIENVRGQLKTFKKNKIAFAYEISKLLAQFKSCSVKPEELNENVEGMTGAKYHDLKLIFNEYNRLLGDKLDVNARLELLSEKLNQNLILRDEKLYFAGFDAFTKESFELIKNLLKCVKEVNFALAKSCDSGNEYIYDEDIFEKISKFSKENGVFLSVFNKNTFISPQNEAIIKGLYSYHKNSCDNDGFYNLFSSSSISEEIEGIAKLIRYKVYKGLKFSDIQIAVGDIEKYQVQIENIFEKYNIPFYIDSSLTADRTLLGRVVLEFLECASFGFNGERLINLLSNILLGGNSELIERCQIYNVDNKNKYKKYIEKDFVFSDLIKQFEDARTSAEYGEAIGNLMKRVEENFDKVMEKLENEEFLKEKNINIQIFEVIEETIELINKFDSGEIEIDEYRRKFNLLLSFKEVSTVPTYVDGVMIGDATSSFFSLSDTLIVMGGQALPLTSQDNGLLSDEEMGANLKELEPTIRMINRRNRFKIYSLLSLAKNQLFITYQFLSEEGKKNELPSYITSLNSIFKQTSVKASNIFFNKNPKSVSQALISAEFGENARKTHKKRDFYLNFDEFKKKNSELCFKQNKIKVTELEQYFSCPFKHFVVYGLKLKEKELKEFDQRDIGNICHEGAEEFVKVLMKNGFNLGVDIDKIADEILTKILNKEEMKEKLNLLEEKESFVYYIKRHLKSNFKDIITEIQKSSFRPKYLEMPIEGRLEIEGEEYSLIGRADRIDTCGDYFRIIDYKSGATGAILKDLYYGEKLQLFLYQQLFEEKLNKNGVGGFYFNAKLDYAKNEDDKVLLKGLAEDDEEILVMLDNDLEDGKSKVLPIARAVKGGFKGSGISKYPLRVLKDYSLKVAEKAVREIIEGYYRASPCSGACKYCNARAICGYESSMGERKNLKDKVNF